MVYLNIFDPTTGDYRSKIIHKSYNNATLAYQNNILVDISSFSLNQNNLVGDRVLRFWMTIHSNIISIGLGHSVGAESTMVMHIHHPEKEGGSFQLSRVSIMSSGASVKWSLCRLKHRINIYNYLKRPILFRLSEKGIEEKHRTLLIEIIHCGQTLGMDGEFVMEKKTV